MGGWCRQFTVHYAGRKDPSCHASEKRKGEERSIAWYLTRSFNLYRGKLDEGSTAISANSQRGRGRNFALTAKKACTLSPVA